MKMFVAASRRIRRARPTANTLQPHMISVFHDSRDSHTLLQDAMVKGPVRFGTAVRALGPSFITRSQ